MDTNDKTLLESVNNELRVLGHGKISNTDLNKHETEYNMLVNGAGYLYNMSRDLDNRILDLALYIILEG